MNAGSLEHDSDSSLLLIDTSIVGVTVGIMSSTTQSLVRTTQGSLALAAHEGHYDNVGSIAMISTLADRCLTKAHRSPANIRGIVVSTGPGSFTGIKIGLAFAQGWACGLANGAQWLGVSALERAAIHRSRHLGNPKNVALFLPATRTHGFLAETQGSQTKPARLIDVSSWDRTTKSFAGDPYHPSPTDHIEVVGHWPLLEKTLQDQGFSFQARPAQDVALEALLSMAELAAQAWPKDFSTCIPSPNYLRLSTAEEQLAQRAALARRQEDTP
jgi:tRNA threonylcarbamoyl adenosine modification protein YeaZ